VYAQPPFGGPEHVFRYLGRYSHRVAIANSRLVAIDDGHVSFTWKDYADGSRVKVMRLTADQFLRRFLLHVLPKGFVRVRHYGLMAGSNVATKLARCRELLAAPPRPAQGPRKTWVDRVLEWTGTDPTRCPHCHGALDRVPVAPTSSARSPTPAGAATEQPPPGGNTS
jgi:hypothetical protein